MVGRDDPPPSGDQINISLGSISANRGFLFINKGRRTKFTLMASVSETNHKVKENTGEDFISNLLSLEGPSFGQNYSLRDFSSSFMVMGSFLISYSGSPLLCTQ